MSLPSVVVSMVIFGICLTSMLQGFARGTAAMWNARVNQEATAVAAWHSAVAQQQGCSSYPQTVTSLAGRDVLPHEGFTVRCGRERRRGLASGSGERWNTRNRQGWSADHPSRMEQPQPCAALV